jgi:hypothetical protein
MEKFVKFLEAFVSFALRAVTIALPWLAPIPSAVIIAKAAHVELSLDWVTSTIIGIFLDGFGIVAVVLLTKLKQYNAQRLDGEPVAPVKNAWLLVLAYITSAIWLTVFLKIFPESILKPLSYAIFPLITLSGAMALSLSVSHDELLAKVSKDRAANAVATRKAAEKEARRIAKLEKEAARLAERERKANELAFPVAQKFPVPALVEIPEAYKGKISTKLANDPRYVAFFVEQVQRNGKGMMPVEEIMKLTGAPRKTAYNYTTYYKRDMSIE